MNFMMHSTVVARNGWANGHLLFEPLQDRTLTLTATQSEQTQAENHRELLCYGYEERPDLPQAVTSQLGSAFLCRTYRIIAGGRPVMMINEKFPLRQPERPNV